MSGEFGGFASVIRRLVRVAIGRYAVKVRGVPPAPSVYVVHHRNTRGPITSIAWLGTHCHLWALSAFFTRRGCFEQYIGYTFTRRYGMPRFFAAAIALPASLFVSRLLNSLKAIPVYRGSTRILSTLRLTVAALKGGENVLISPDIDYTDTGSGMGVMHEGFLHVEKFFSAETGTHASFVPVHIDRPASSHLRRGGHPFPRQGELQDRKGRGVREDQAGVFQAGAIGTGERDGVRRAAAIPQPARSPRGRFAPSGPRCAGCPRGCGCPS